MSNQVYKLWGNINVLCYNSIGIIKYDPKILDAFQNQTEIYVIVQLADNSGIIIEGTKEEKIELMRQRDDWFRPRVDEVFATLSEENIRDGSKSSNGFGGYITEEGFYKLTDNVAVKKIIWVTTGSHSTLDKSVSLINATNVHDLSYNGTGKKICVIDGGVNKSHPDLSGKIIDEYCYCSTPDALLSSSDCCPDGTSLDDNATDYHGHGTHVTGIIASQHSTWKGVAYGAEIYVVKVHNSSGKGDAGSWQDIGKAIDWCRINKSVDIISISIGDGGNYPGAEPCKDYIDDKINDAYNAGIPVIISSGNDGYITGINYPACSPNAISVGMTYDEGFVSVAWGGSVNCTDIGINKDNIACASNRAGNLDLLAPGFWIKSTVIGGGFDNMGGTSMAAPHVAGAAALLLEKDPTLTPDKIRETLKDEANSVEIYDSPYTNKSFRRINVLAALNSLCIKSNWTAGECGGIGKDCTSTGHRYYTRTTTPSECAIESKCEYASSCVIGVDITVCGSGCPAELGCNLYRDDVSVSNPEVLVLGAGSYNYTYNTTGNNNYTSGSVSNILVINQADPVSGMSLTGTSPITFGTAGDFEGTESNNGDGDCVYELFKDGVLVSNPDTEVLGGGSYSYDYNTTGCANYTSGELSDSLTVNKATPTLTFLANGGTSNLSLTYPQQINMSVSASGGSVGLDRDSVGVLGENGLNVTLGVGGYIYRANITGNENYTDVGYEYYNVTISQARKF